MRHHASVVGYFAQGFDVGEEHKMHSAIWPATGRHVDMYLALLPKSTAAVIASSYEKHAKNGRFFIFSTPVRGNGSI